MSTPSSGRGIERGSARVHWPCLSDDQPIGCDAWLVGAVRADSVKVDETPAHKRPQLLGAGKLGRANDGYGGLLMMSPSVGCNEKKNVHRESAAINFAFTCF